MTDPRAYRGRSHPPSCLCVECVGDSPADWEEGHAADMDDWTGKIISYTVPMTGGALTFRVDRCIEYHPATKKPWKYEVSKLIPGGDWTPDGYWNANQIKDLLTRPGAKVTDAPPSSEKKPKATKAQAARLERKRVLREMEDKHSLDCSCFQCVTVQDPSVARRNRNRDEESERRKLEDERRELKRARRETPRSDAAPTSKSGRHPPTCLCFQCKESARSAQIDARLRENEREIRESKRRERELRPRSRLMLKGVVAVFLTGMVVLGGWGAWTLFSAPQGATEPPAITPAPPDAPDVVVIKFSHNAENDNQTKSVETAVAGWMDSNPLIKFEPVAQSETGVELLITFMDLPDGGAPVGLYCPQGCDSDDYGGEAMDGARADKGYAEILVDTGRAFCRLGPSEYNINFMANTVAHEIGHHLGIGHHPAEENLLYGEENGVDSAETRAFNDLGYDIPPKLPEDGVVVQAAELMEFLQEVEGVQNAFLMAGGDMLKERYEKAMDDLSCIDMTTKFWTR